MDFHLRLFQAEGFPTRPGIDLCHMLKKFPKLHFDQLAILKNNLGTDQRNQEPVIENKIITNHTIQI